MHFMGSLKKRAEFLYNLQKYTKYAKCDTFFQNKSNNLPA